MEASSVVDLSGGGPASIPMMGVHLNDGRARMEV